LEFLRAGSAPNGGPIGSDGGLLLGEVETRTGIIAGLAE
jgi:hypothetical protein